MNTIQSKELILAFCCVVCHKKFDKYVILEYIRDDVDSFVASNFPNWVYLSQICNDEASTCPFMPSFVEKNGLIIIEHWKFFQTLKHKKNILSFRILWILLFLLSWLNFSIVEIRKQHSWFNGFLFGVSDKNFFCSDLKHIKNLNGII